MRFKANKLYTQVKVGWVGVKGGFTLRIPFGCHGTWVSWCIWERMSFVTKSMPQIRNYREVKEATD